jgi:hypothetical protein
MLPVTASALAVVRQAASVRGGSVAPGKRLMSGFVDNGPGKVPTAVPQHMRLIVHRTRTS